MKKIYTLLIVIAVVLTSCLSKEESTSNGKSTLYTSIYPVYYIVSNIVGDKIEVKNIIPNDSDPHSWEPTPKDMAKIEDSKLIFINGLGMESWTDSLSSVVSEDKFFEVSKNVELIDLEEEHDEHDHGEYDPHIWMSVKNMKVMSENVYEKIVRLDENNKDYYLENYEKLIKNLDKLEEDYNSTLSKYKGKAIVVPHEAFGYLARDYKLEQISVEGINSSSEPDLGKMAEIVNLAKKDSINTVFYEFGGSDKIAKSIAREINGKVLSLYTIENITDKQEKSGQDYISMMYENLESLEKSFKE